MVRKKINAAMITVNHMIILKDSKGCLKLLAANIIAVMEQAIEIYNINL